jgi:hypothetical protein
VRGAPEAIFAVLQVVSLLVKEDTQPTEVVLCCCTTRHYVVGTVSSRAAPNALAFSTPRYGSRRRLKRG